MSQTAPARRGVVVASSNLGKLAEIRSILADLELDLRGLDEFPAVALPEEGEDYAANALGKAGAVARQLALPAIADDSGLEVDALDGAPGPRSARYGGPEIDDRARVERLLAAIAAARSSQRTARFVCAAALALPSGVEIVVWGECKGTILTSPRGQGGFGYDPIFQPLGLCRSLAEIPAREKNRLSHRAQAFRALASELQRQVIEAP